MLKTHIAHTKHGQGKAKPHTAPIAPPLSLADLPDMNRRLVRAYDVVFKQRLAVMKAEGLPIICTKCKHGIDDEIFIRYHTFCQTCFFKVNTVLAELAFNHRQQAQHRLKVQTRNYHTNYVLAPSYSLKVAMPC